mmetsp:Transcript_24714/g.63309  ORF Transcript_24714/g.63309 Transcript_24714/m.63309 type:complete len:89 (-) Transcript_24714:751-1017(-)
MAEANTKPRLGSNSYLLAADTRRVLDDGDCGDEASGLRRCGPPAGEAGAEAGHTRRPTAGWADEGRRADPAPAPAPAVGDPGIAPTVA